MSGQEHEAPAIEDHGVIGDLRTAALVCMDGNIDFLCLPRHDAPTVFASLLDPRRGGRFQLSPRLPVTRHQQMYLPDTNVLLTRFMSPDGVAEIVDFMPPAPVFAEQAVIRIVRGVRGHSVIHLHLLPRFDYGRVSARAWREGSTIVLAPEIRGDEPAGPALRLRTPTELTLLDTPAGLAVHAVLTVGPGQELAFVLELAPQAPHGPDASPYASPAQVHAALDATVGYWRRWAAGVEYRGRWAETVRRSALTLKLLTCERHGAIVAAPTFGLPERIGGAANWDYRYCWTRDTAFAMEALNRLGLRDEAWALAGWLEQRCCDERGATPLEVLYTAAGEPAPIERSLDSLAGYRGSRPVRIGNGASGQLQLDIVGEFIQALYAHDPTGRSLPQASWAAVIELLATLERLWAAPDHGIWELRGRPRERLHSRVMAWIAFDRGIRLARGCGRPAPIERWRVTRDAIFANIGSQFWDPHAQTYVGVAGEPGLDAAALVMPLLGFISPREPRWRATMAAIGERLVEDSLVYRLERVADDPAGPGTFSLCTFWYVECLSRGGRLYEARNIFERMLRHANHLGLYAEQLGRCGEHLGNFPQGLTHVGLINAAVDLDARLDARAAPGGGRLGPSD